MTTANLSSSELGGMLFPPELQADLRVARALDKAVFIKRLTPLPGKCQNCSGEGYLYFQFAKAGPFDSPVDHGLHTFANGKWWKVESKFYACPACNSRASQVEYLFSGSGLETSERGWSLDFVRGMEGKGAAVESAETLINQIPRPHGWLVIHGMHGMGKSGVLRSVVAACCREMVSARYVRAEDFLRELRTTFGDGSEVSEDAMVQRYGRYQVLAIDEVDRVSDTKWSKSALFTLLDTRYKRRSELATLLATNCDPTQMPAGFEYLQSRMKHGERVEMVGKDLRDQEIM